jgi:hypothetical protein
LLSGLLNKSRGLTMNGEEVACGYKKEKESNI